MINTKLGRSIARETGIALLWDSLIRIDTIGYDISLAELKRRVVAAYAIIDGNVDVIPIKRESIIVTGVGA
ncbi:hypothetical protein GN244_ATG13431 [Phytophthora infestans]|uniref:Uncharacterized protein n=1 Tax=Phytophthora infestans TaxID=4787 RepID=A0A833WH82_PHYIN|nr:hypothetical protein GN244_ATG13431 [Phytophthora infestans]